MAKNIRAKVKILRVERKGCSVNGNPSFWVWFLNKETGKELKGYTSPDAACAYGIKSNGYNWLEYHETRNGNIVITQGDRDREQE